ncbi:hypothetical protein ACH5RR_001246 [Cinchona calisaya]|uniref:Uncharacterized protein n=1 Tax=Cinchona calisaya TaxID=153742 RepID=A0ABD3B2Y3_9GENT
MKILENARSLTQSILLQTKQRFVASALEYLWHMKLAHKKADVKKFHQSLIEKAVTTSSSQQSPRPFSSVDPQKECHDFQCLLGDPSYISQKKSAMVRSRVERICLGGSKTRGLLVGIDASTCLIKIK